MGNSFFLKVYFTVDCLVTPAYGKVDKLNKNIHPIIFTLKITLFIKSNFHFERTLIQHIYDAISSKFHLFQLYEEFPCKNKNIYIIPQKFQALQYRKVSKFIQESFPEKSFARSLE